MITSFSALGIDLPYIALIVLHRFVGSVLWSNVSTNSPRYIYIYMLVRCSGDPICYREGEVSGSEVILFYHFFQYLCWCDAALRMMECKFFSPFWQLVGSRIFLSLSSIFLLSRSHIFQVDAGTMLYLVDSDVHL